MRMNDNFSDYAGSAINYDQPDISPPSSAPSSDSVASGRSSNSVASNQGNTYVNPAILPEIKMPDGKIESANEPYPQTALSQKLGNAFPYLRQQPVDPNKLFINSFKIDENGQREITSSMSVTQALDKMMKGEHLPNYDQNRVGIFYTPYSVNYDQSIDYDRTGPNHSASDKDWANGQSFVRTEKIIHEVNGEVAAHNQVKDRAPTSNVTRPGETDQKPTGQGRRVDVPEQLSGPDIVNVKQPDKEVNTYQNVTVRPHVHLTYAEPVVTRTNTPEPVNIAYNNFINLNIDTKFGVSSHESYTAMYPTGQSPSGQPSWAYGSTVNPNNIVIGNGFFPDGRGGYYRDLSPSTPRQSTG